MPYTTLMVQVDAGSESGKRVEIAGQFADRFNSHFIGICIWMPRSLFAIEGATIDPKLTTSGLHKRFEILAKHGNEFEAALRLDPSRTERRCSLGFPSEYIARGSQVAGLVIVSDEQQTSDPYAFLDPEELLLRTVPFMKKSETVIVSEIFERSDEAPSNQLRLCDIAEYLHRHQIMMVIEHVQQAEGDTTNMLLLLAHEESADLIVSGAYGHSRLGECAFGGMTQDLLMKSPIRCLFSH